MHFLDPPASLAQHYFVPNPTTGGQGLSPKWDFTSSGKFAGNADAFVVAKGVGSLPSPDDPSKDVAWLEVQAVQGEIADVVFRTDTVGGQPPSSVSFCFGFGSWDGADEMVCSVRLATALTSQSTMCQNTVSPPSALR